MVDPRFTRSASVADVYAPIRQGTDIGFLLGVINYCVQNNKVQWDYVKGVHERDLPDQGRFTDTADGLFTGRRGSKRDYDRSSWVFEIGDDGFVKVDATLENPRCVWNLYEGARQDLRCPILVDATSAASLRTSS